MTLLASPYEAEEVRSLGEDLPGLELLDKPVTGPAVQRLLSGLGLAPVAALTVTIPTLINTAAIVCTVIGPRKAQAVARAFAGPVDPDCPASVLQRCRQASILLDRPAAAQLINRPESLARLRIDGVER